MKYLFTLAFLIGLAMTGFAQGSHYVQGYYQTNGTYVAPHYQTNPNGNASDNWITRGNYNPYTGQPGTVNPYAPKGHYYYDAYGNLHFAAGNGY